MQIYNRILRFTFSKITPPTKSRYIPNLKNDLFEKYFQSNEQIVIMRAAEVQKLGIPKPFVQKLLSTTPQLFDIQGSHLKIVSNLNQVKKLAGQQGVVAAARNPALLNLELLAANIQTFKDHLQLDDKQIKKILKYYPKAFGEKLIYRIQQRKTTLTSCLYITEKQIAQLCVKWPFFLNMNENLLNSAIRFLLSQKFNRDEVKKFLLDHITIFSMSVTKLNKSMSLPKEWGVTNDELIHNHFVDHPQFLSICPFEIMTLKLNLLRSFKVDVRVLQEMFQKYPISLIAGVNNLQAKLLFCKDRLRIPLKISPLFPYIISLNYNQRIRPRGELLVKYSLPIEVEQWTCTDQQFVQRNNMTLDTLENQRKRFPISRERDYKKKFYSDCILTLVKDGHLQYHP